MQRAVGFEMGVGRTTGSPRRGEMSSFATSPIVRLSQEGGRTFSGRPSWDSVGDIVDEVVGTGRLDRGGPNKVSWAYLRIQVHGVECADARDYYLVGMIFRFQDQRPKVWALKSYPEG